jgi:hypothetical protein
MFTPLHLIVSPSTASSVAQTNSVPINGLHLAWLAAHQRHRRFPE